MNLFRSEEHIERWLGGREPGATISVAKLAELAHGVVGRSALAGLAPAFTGGERGDPREVGAHRRLLAARVKKGPYKCQVLRPRKATGLDKATLAHPGAHVKRVPPRTSRNLRESTLNDGASDRDRRRVLPRPGPCGPVRLVRRAPRCAGRRRGRRPRDLPGEPEHRLVGVPGGYGLLAAREEAAW